MSISQDKQKLFILIWYFELYPLSYNNRQFKGFWSRRCPSCYL